MSSLAALCVTAVIVWAACVLIAHLVNPGQDPLAMGMSGLARGDHGWLMRVAFVARGASALLLVAVLVLEVPADAWSRGGMALLWVWELGSALLAGLAMVGQFAAFAAAARPSAGIPPRLPHGRELCATLPSRR